MYNSIIKPISSCLMPSKKRRKKRRVSQSYKYARRVSKKYGKRIKRGAKRRIKRR